MERDSKVTIKPFINYKLKPESWNGKDCYPLYYLITYQRRNTQIKSRYTNAVDEDEFKSLKVMEMITFESKNLSRLVHWLIKEEGDGFSLMGLGNKYQAASESTLLFFDQKLKDQLMRINFKGQPFEYTTVLNYDSAHNNCITLFEVSGKIFDNYSEIVPAKFTDALKAFKVYNSLYNPVFDYNFQIMLDWMMGEGQLATKADLVAKLNMKEEKATEIIKTLANLIK